MIQEEEVQSHSNLYDDRIRGIARDIGGRRGEK